MMRDHGGDLDRARATYGGTDWLDLSTGINAKAYPMPTLEGAALTALPTNEAVSRLETTAALSYGTKASVVALSGAQAAIQLMPRLKPRGRAAVLSPSYNEHAGALEAQGWDVANVNSVEAMVGADLAVVVNPNNPDGRSWSPVQLAELAETVGFLVVDESFVDPHPELSLAGQLHVLAERVLVLRSFGKFFGLAGLRLGFALGGPKTIKQIRTLAGPWAISGPAIAAGQAALADEVWKSHTVARLAQDAARLDAMAATAGWTLVGGTALFRTYHTKDAVKAQAHLARHAIWTRVFPYSSSWIRLGLPGDDRDWRRLETALTSGS